MTEQSKIEEAPQAEPAQAEKRVISRTTFIAAVVVLAAVALIIILAAQG